MQGLTAPRKATNLTLDPVLLMEARSFGVNLSKAAEAGLRRAVAVAKVEAWQRENATALASSNAWIEAQGLPLDAYRQF
ncbi:type II toxin-antitoxin system CcdA family antitoxin [Paracoccus marcusii]|uniref:type II toxin-antitoxin system CcdA family antitoxin n=1 Tax=Paracoccus marcusii TaxID=59779 RepID=UPI00249060F7|nr:type II toxin-antitoxin system CcdA family antitoxin [Paracoccus marcusii]